MKSDDLSWCIRQKKGLRLTKPSNNLCRVYLAKSKSSLNMLKSAIEKNEVDWIVSTSYYAKYFAFYALFSKCGFKCEIHDCTISAMKVLFVDTGITEKKFYDELSESKDLRIDVQYYAYKELDRERIMKFANSAGDFVLEMERIIEKISKKQIDSVREKFSKLR